MLTAGCLYVWERRKPFCFDKRHLCRFTILDYCLLIHTELVWSGKEQVFSMLHLHIITIFKRTTDGLFVSKALIDL